MEDAVVELFAAAEVVVDALAGGRHPLGGRVVLLVARVEEALRADTSAKPGAALAVDGCHELDRRADRGIGLDEVGQGIRPRHAHREPGLGSRVLGCQAVHGVPHAQRHGSGQVGDQPSHTGALTQPHPDVAAPARECVEADGVIRRTPVGAAPRAATEGGTAGRGDATVEDAGLELVQPVGRRGAGLGDHGVDAVGLEVARPRERPHPRQGADDPTGVVDAGRHGPRRHVQQRRQRPRRHRVTRQPLTPPTPHHARSERISGVQLGPLVTPPSDGLHRRPLPRRHRTHHPLRRQHQRLSLLGREVGDLVVSQREERTSKRGRLGHLHC
ncbi:hypothetical protein [Pedococcus bigeumensis]|uniref:hypothetical protein n=1 Tax=Pedococcus bigeumensis TaxID=433644 RepID=UPI0031DB9439